MNEKPNAVAIPLVVRSIGMDARKEAVFRMAFKMNRRLAYRLLENGEKEKVDLAIADLDSPEGLAQARTFAREQPHIPLLGTSTTPEQYPEFRVLRKPIRMETLFPALAQLLQQPANAPASLPPVETASPPPPKPEASQPSTKAADADLRVSLSRRWNPEQVEYFDPDQGILALVQRAVRDQIPTQILNPEGKLLWRILPGDGLVESYGSSTEENKALTDPERLQVRVDSSQANGQPKHQQGLQEFLWSFSAAVARGRMSRRIPLHHPVKLQRWPNLTRLRPLPEALRLSAFLARSPASPLLTIRMLQVEPADLFNFLAASDGIGILQYGPAATSTIPSNQTTPATSEASTRTVEPPSPKRGLLGRLLAKIAGL